MWPEGEVDEDSFGVNGRRINEVRVSDQSRVNIPNMCQMHQSLLVHQASYGPDDPWRVLIVMAQVALFQAATADPYFHERTGGDIFRTSEIGCLACFKPDAFGEIVEAAKDKNNPGAIKRLGESWLKK
jgi:hypothetical protein